MLQRVKQDLLASLRKRGEILIDFVVHRRGVLMRALLCWAIGCLALSADEVNSYDRRFNLRGDQAMRADIAVVTLFPSDFVRAFGIRSSSFAQASEITDITDSFFWDRRTWRRMLQRILQDNPRSIGVTLWFGDNIGNIQLSDEERQVLQDPRVIWSTSINNLERMMTPAFSVADLSNIGSSDLRRDEDGIVRRLFPNRMEVPHFIERLTQKTLPSSSNALVVNFRGGSRLVTHYTLGDLMNDELPQGSFKGKIVIIGADTGNSPRFLTPLGPMNRADLTAQLVDNQLENRWIQRPPFNVLALGMLGLTIFAVFLITTYPQSVVLLFFLWIATLAAALSAWVFDNFSIWLPAFSPFVLLASTWLVFIGYRATSIERLNAQLQQERRSLHELEQLKNNFVSLISHDLKTPIAKIQAVVDRLITQNPASVIEPDLKNLRDFSDELNRYIQSILKVLRVESRDIKLNREVADINEIINEALRQLAPLASEKKIEIQTQLEPMFSSEFDVTLIKEVVINLIENAIKYTPDNGKISIRSNEIDDEVRVEISDTGQGIPAEDIEHVWRKFERGRGQDLKTKGSGLGLYLVKYFIELHEGRVYLQSQVDKGTTVSFTLPLVDDQKKPTEVQL